MMRRSGGWGARGVLTVTGLLFASALGAASTRTLWDGIALPQSAESPGRVIFNHTTHLDEARPDCTVCHPRLFSILPAQERRLLTGRAPKRGVIVHASMEKGEHCGACHNGKRAFALEDDCTACHQP